MPCWYLLLYCTLRTFGVKRFYSYYYYCKLRVFLLQLNLPTDLTVVLPASSDRTPRLLFLLRVKENPRTHGGAFRSVLYGYLQAWKGEVL